MKEVPVTSRKHPGLVALVDDNQYEELSSYAWSLDGSGYPQRSIKTSKGWRPIRMHRHILGLIGRQGADHWNLNKLDNQINNLRRASQKQNNRNGGIRRNNSSGYKGVTYNRKRHVWQAYITADLKHLYLGAFSDAREAALAYNVAATLHHGEFARLNEVPDGR